MSRHTILFLAANPLGTDRLALDEEARAIQIELERSGQRDRFELVTRWAARPLDLLRELRKLRPTIVHFSGHGTSQRTEIRTLSTTLPTTDPTAAGSVRDVVFGADSPGGGLRHGLFFQNDNGQAQIVSSSALEETFGAAGASVKLVVLNACFSDIQADALLVHVDCVVGVIDSIRDTTARIFAIGFYGGLGEGQSIAAAHRQGGAAFSLEALRNGERPQLRVREGIDAERVIMAEACPHNAPVHASQARSGTSQMSRSVPVPESGSTSLELLLCKYEGAVLPLPSSGKVRIGRLREFELMLTDDEISRFHAQIVSNDGSLSISDQGSANGTFVNGARVSAARDLRVGDCIVVGTCIMKIGTKAGAGLSLEQAESRFQARKRTGGSNPAKWPSPHKSGLLQEILIRDLLCVLHACPLQGILTVRSLSYRGSIGFEGGYIQHAMVAPNNRDGSIYDGHEALIEIFGWQEGSFELAFSGGWHTGRPTTGKRIEEVVHQVLKALESRSDRTLTMPPRNQF